MFATLVLAGCIHSGDDGDEAPPGAVEPASAEGGFREQGVTTVVRGWNCGGVYGRWNVRVEGPELDVRGEASAKALFVRVQAPIDERLPIRRGPIAECR